MDKAFVLYKLKKYDESINICKDYLNKKKDINCMNILALNYFSTNNGSEVLIKANTSGKNNIFYNNKVKNLIRYEGVKKPYEDCQ